MSRWQYDRCMSTLDQIAESALGLLVSDRMRLVARLLEGLDEDSHDPEVQKAWEVEVARRVRDLVEGRAKTIPAEQALSEARSKLARQP